MEIIQIYWWRSFHLLLNRILIRIFLNRPQLNLFAFSSPDMNLDVQEQVGWGTRPQVFDPNQLMSVPHSLKIKHQKWVDHIIDMMCYLKWKVMLAWKKSKATNMNFVSKGWEKLMLLWSALGTIFHCLVDGTALGPFSLVMELSKSCNLGKEIVFTPRFLPTIFFWIS